MSSYEVKINRRRAIIFASPHRLSWEGRPFDDRIQTYEDHESWFKHLEESDSSWEIYAPTRPLTKNTKEEFFSPSRFQPLGQLIFNTANSHIATKESNEEVLTLLVYLGHGLAPNSDSVLQSLPLDNQFSEDDQVHFGGEFFFHEQGFATLKQMLKNWLETIRKHEQKNAHYLLIADSCYSGALLKALEDIDVPEGCSVTIRSSCGSEEKAFSGFFTPTFLRLQKEETFNYYKERWDNLSDDGRQTYNDRPQRNMAHRTRGREYPYKLRFFNDSDSSFLWYCYEQFVGETAGETSLPRHIRKADSDLFFDNAYNVVCKSVHLKRYSVKVTDTKMAVARFEIKVDGLDKSAISLHIHYSDEAATTISRINLFEPKQQQNFQWVEDDRAGRYPIKMKTASANRISNVYLLHQKIIGFTNAVNPSAWGTDWRRPSNEFIYPKEGEPGHLRSLEEDAEYYEFLRAKRAESKQLN